MTPPPRQDRWIGWEAEDVAWGGGGGGHHKTRGRLEFYLMFMLKYIFRIYEDRLYSKLPYPTWKLNYHYLDIIKYTYKKSFYTRDRWFTLILEELVWICFKLYSYRNQIVPLRGWIYNNLSAKETPNNVWDFMPKVGKCIFTEVQIVLHQMQCSETQFFVVYLSVTREPNVHRIQRITRL